MTERVIIYLNGSMQETILSEGKRFFEDYGHLECGDCFLSYQGDDIVSYTESGKLIDYYSNIDEALSWIDWLPSQVQRVEEIKEGWTSYDLYSKVESLEGEVWVLKTENKWFLEVLKKDLLDAGILETPVNDKIKQALLSIGIKYD